MADQNQHSSLKPGFGSSMGLLFLSCIAFNSAAFEAGIQRTSIQSAAWGTENNLTIEDSRSVSTHIDIDTATRYQTIEFLGGCFNELGWKALQSLPAAGADSVIASLFDTVTGCKFNACRMPIGASDYGLNWYSLDETVDDTLMTAINIDRDKECLNRYIKAAMKYNPNLRMWASPWSPPTWMKTNGAYSGSNSSFRQEPAYLKAYALYLAKAIKLFQDDGIKVEALSFQNEPYAAPSYPGCLWSASQMRDFIKNHLGPRFEADQVSAEIWTPTMNNGEFNNFKIMLGDADAAKYIKAACFQWEGKNAVGTVHTAYPNLRLFQTENECGDGTNTWAYAENPTFFYMKFYFDNGANGYFQWNMVLDNSGRSSWNWAQNAMVSIDTAQKRVIYNPQYYLVKHFSYYVRPGAKKIKTSGNYSNQIAFLNPDGSVVVVLINTSTTQVSLGVNFGAAMVNTQLPGKSLNTIVLSNANGAVRPDKRVAGYAAKAPARVTVHSGILTFARQGNSFSAHLFNLGGNAVNTSPAIAGNTVVMHTQGIRSGSYILKRVIDGRAFGEKVIINQ
jgi:glucosylceramidase